MSVIKLNFINNSNDTNNTSLVIIAQSYTGLNAGPIVAWEVIDNWSPGSNQLVTYSIQNTISAVDANGNYSPQLTAIDGQKYEVVMTANGEAFQPAGSSASPDSIEVANHLERGSINANIYNSGKLFATRTGISPGQKAVFKLKPAIWVGVASGIEEGKILNSTIASQINNEITLFGFLSADVIMTGGGTGTGGTPIQFTLHNIVKV